MPVSPFSSCCSFTCSHQSLSSEPNHLIPKSDFTVTERLSETTKIMENYTAREIKEVLPLIISHDAGRLNFQIRKRSRHQTHCICTHPASLIPQIPRRKNMLVYSMDRRMRTNQVCHWDGRPFQSIKICFTALPFCFLEPEVTMSG